MLVTLSPAKSLDFSPQKEGENFEYKTPEFLEQTKILKNFLENFSSQDLQKLMKISKNIADINVQRFSDWNENFSLETKKKSGDLDCKPAFLAFTGDVFKNIDVHEFSDQNFLFAEENFRILSGFYGLISPLTLIKPYRLEMGTKISVSGTKNLYEFWSEILTEKISEDLEEKRVWVNLASEEYSKVIDRKKIKAPILDIEFLTEKNGVLKNIGVIGKRHRGRISNFIITEEITDVENIKLYENDGFSFSKENSSQERFVFVKKA